jgi:hypothetical protein
LWGLEVRARLRSDNPVGRQAALSLEGFHSFLSARPEDAVGAAGLIAKLLQPSLQVTYLGPSATTPQHHA